MCVSDVDSISKMGTRLSRAPSKMESPGFVHMQKCPAVHHGGVQSVHKRHAQNCLTLWEEPLTVWGGELWSSK
jgi:hypothetical protein